MKKKIDIFDTTLRDGSQAPSCGLHLKEKAKIAKDLDKLGVNIIEAGFPVSSDLEFYSVKSIAKLFSKNGPVVCGFSRLTKKDIDSCWDSVKYAKKRRIHLGIATSDQHLTQKLFLTKREVLDKIDKQIKYARKFNWEIQFYAEDASRTELNFLKKAFSTAYKSGARNFLIADTVGIKDPLDYGKIIKKLKNYFYNKKNVKLSTHCHDDLGLAVANTLSGISSGATEVQGTILGIGERCGNASLEEIILNLNENYEYKNKFSHSIKSKNIYQTCLNVSNLMNIAIPLNKSLIGKNSFATEAGIHVDGSIKNSKNYLAFNPSKYLRKEEYILGARSGKATLEYKLNQMRLKIKNKDDFNNFFIFIKKIADKRLKQRGISNDELVNLYKNFFK